MEKEAIKFDQIVGITVRIKKNMGEIRYFEIKIVKRKIGKKNR